MSSCKEQSNAAGLFHGTWIGENSKSESKKFPSGGTGREEVHNILKTFNWKKGKERKEKENGAWGKGVQLATGTINRRVTMATQIQIRRLAVFSFTSCLSSLCYQNKRKKPQIYLKKNLWRIQSWQNISHMGTAKWAQIIINHNSTYTIKSSLT